MGGDGNLYGDSGILVIDKMEEKGVSSVLFYSSPAVIEFQVLLVVVEVRGRVVIVVVVERLMGTATVVIAI